jgi:hypothetical protein
MRSHAVGTAESYATRAGAIVFYVKVFFMKGLLFLTALE